MSCDFRECRRYMYMYVCVLLSHAPRAWREYSLRVRELGQARKIF